MRGVTASLLLLIVSPVACFISSVQQRTFAFGSVTSLKLFGRGKSRQAKKDELVTGPDGKPASSAEEDLELTYKVIMDFVTTNDESNAEASLMEDNESTKKKKEKKKKSPDTSSSDVDVSKLDIRVGIITKVWEHEEADKLFCEEIDIGEKGGPRQIASGLRAHYSAEDLEGRKVCVLSNLKARKLVGFKSHGMVLCASTEDGSKVVFVDPPKDAEVGERVMAEGFDGEPATENQVIKKKMLESIFPDLRTDADGVATYKGIALTAGTGKCTAQDGLANAQVS